MDEHWWNICPEVGTCANTQEEPKFTIEKLDGIMENLLKNKVEVKCSVYVDKEKYFIIDHEKLRGSMPFCEERGKTIVCHPTNEVMVRFLMNGLK